MIQSDPPPPKHLYELTNVSKIYPAQPDYSALNEVNLSVAPGEFLAVMGKSGSGKSTLLNLLGTLDRQSNGDVYMLDRDISAMPEREIAHLRNETIGFVFQSFNLLPTMSVLENIALPALYSGASGRIARKRALGALELLGMESFAIRRPNELSGGQQQRCAIARALVNDPRVILADEPTGNLDSQTSKEVLSLLQTLNQSRGVAVVLITHDQAVAETANRRIHMNDGHITYDSATSSTSAI